MSQITCLWVPGTTDTVRLITAKVTRKIALKQLGQLLDRQAVNDLFLQGRHSREVTPDELARLLEH